MRGWERAGALVQFFANPRDPNGPIKQPATIFATEPSSQTASKRPLHTVTPLAKFLGIAINSAITEGSEQELVNTAIASTGVVLIAWHHEAIPAIANLILQNRARRRSGPATASTWCGFSPAPRRTRLGPFRKRRSSCCPAIPRT